MASLEYVELLKAEKGGFNFDNIRRNALLADKGVKFPPAKKTGTTICGLVVKDAVILGADTRATGGPIVADKDASKIHRLAENIYTSGAGTSADLTHTTSMVASNVELHRLNTGTQPRVATVVSMLSQYLFKYQGHVGCALVLGGVDFNGPQLYKIHPHGSTDCLPFASMGSGMLAALSVLEAGYKDGMSIEEGKKLVADAIRAGIFNDLGSGGNVDICIIQKDGAEHIRKYDAPNPRTYRMPKPVTFNKGTTVVLETVTTEVTSTAS